MSRESFEYGYLLGICGNRQPVVGGAKEPVAYLYNGYGPIPDIYDVYTPELQKVYPYASLSFDWYGNSTSYFLNAAYLHLSTIPLYEAGNLSGLLPQNRAYPKENGTSICFVANDYGGSVGNVVLKPFVRMEEKDAALTAGKLANFNLNWTNYDVYSAVDDSLRFTASDPIPVYE